jgi:hypothetical protein
VQPNTDRQQQCRHNGVDPRAVDQPNDLLDRKDLYLKQKTAEANELARKYNGVNG